MPSNDKISLMTAATAGNLAGSTTGVEVSSLMTTVPVTYSATLALLRTTMFAGGTGYTATDPITAGAASFTTLEASGAVNFGANTLTAGAASFTTLAASSTLAVTGTSTLTGAVGLGGAGSATTGLQISSAAMTGANQIGMSSRATFQSAATVSGFSIYAYFQTAAAAFTMANGYSFFADTPSLGNTAVTTIYGAYISNQGQAKSTNAYGVYIAAQSGAATTNIGLYNGGTLSQQGAATFSSTVAVTSWLSIAGAAASQAAGVLSIGNTTQATVGAAGGASALPATPTGYIKTYIGATQYVIPYYAQA